MRARFGAIAGILMLGLVGTASAQQQASSFMTGVPASQIKSTPIDTSKAIAPHQGSSALFNRFDFTSLFNKNTIPTYPPKRGISPLPAPSSFPSTKYQNFKMVGDPPYLIKWMFGNNKKSAFEPVMPYTPGTTPTVVGPGS